MFISFNGSTHCLLKRFSILPVPSLQNRSASTLCLSCSRMQLGHQKQHIILKRTIVSHIPPIFGTCWSLNTRSHSSSSPNRKSVVIPGLKERRRQTATTTSTAYSGLISTSIDPLQKQQETSTCIAMIYYAKQGKIDQCLQHYLQLLDSQGKLPSHEALHKLARILYIKRHLSGFSILHDTLLAYYKLNPPSGRQSRNLTYIYTMFINLIIRQPSNTKKRLSTSSSYVRNTQRLSDQSAASSASPSMTMIKKTTTIIQLCQEMHELGLAGSPVLYNSLLKFCVLKKDAVLARSLYKELVNICPPTNYTYSILLDLARQQKDSDLILQILDRLDLDGIVPDRPMVSTVMLALCDQQQYLAAIDFVDQLARHAPQAMGLQYKSVLMDTLNRHYQQHMWKHKRRQYPQQQKQGQRTRPFLQTSMEPSPPSSPSSTTATL